jgi:hypothetical protein
MRGRSTVSTNRNGKRGSTGGAGLLLAFLCASLSLASPLRAQSLADYDYENLSFRGAGVDWGYVWPNKTAAAPSYTLRVDLGYLGPGVRVAPMLTYWSSTIKTSELDRLAAQLDKLPALRQRGVQITGSELGPITWRDVGLDVDADFVWNTPAGVSPYLGAGVGVHVLHGWGAAIGGTFVQDLLDTVTPSVSAVGGLEYPVRPWLRVLGEVRGSLLADLRYAGIRLGVTFLLPPRASGAGGTGHH